MDRELIRLECLKLAQAIVGGRGNTEVILTAKSYETFVVGVPPEAAKLSEVPVKRPLSLKTKDGNPSS